MPKKTCGHPNDKNYIFLINNNEISEILMLLNPVQTNKNKTCFSYSFYLTSKDLEELESEQLKNVRNKPQNTKIYEESGYINITELNFGIGVGKSKDFCSYGFQTINGYKFNSNFSIGLGVGIDKYNYATLLPIFIDLRIYHIRNSKPFIYLSGAAGYSCDLSGYSNGYYRGNLNNVCWGPYLNPTLGLRFPLFSKATINLSAGVKFQGNTVSYLNMPIPDNQYLLNLKIGLEF
jgi:hypothetical protein